jgi:hypothetical protein
MAIRNNSFSVEHAETKSDRAYPPSVKSTEGRSELKIAAGQAFAFRIVSALPHYREVGAVRSLSRWIEFVLLGDPSRQYSIDVASS